MDKRDERGIIIAAMCKLENKKGLWSVPSQSQPGKDYVVDPARGICTCPDHQESGYKCKHVRAVEIVIKRETKPDGTITETKSITFTEERKYTQDWPAYNRAQSTEKYRVMALLHDLCRNVAEPQHKGVGRKPHSFKDSIVAMALKVYSQFSSRRASCDLQDAHQRGYLSKPIPGMKVNAFFENPAFTPILKELVAKSAAPLAAVEKDFAVDSSGFSSSRFETWRDEKYGVTRRKCTWVKAHIACGVKTNVITAVRILDKDAADCPQFKPLMKTTGGTFQVSEVSADKAYLSADNFETVADLGGTAFIQFKLNSTGGVGGLFEKMFGYFQFRQDEFMAHYHKRSNVESTFSAVKRKFGDAVRSKTDTAMTNEVLCKFLCHNLCCLIQEQEELGIEAIFGF